MTHSKENYSMFEANKMIEICFLLKLQVRPSINSWIQTPTIWCKRWDQLHHKASDDCSRKFWIQRLEVYQCHNGFFLRFVHVTPDFDIHQLSPSRAPFSRILIELQSIDLISIHIHAHTQHTSNRASSLYSNVNDLVTFSQQQQLRKHVVRIWWSKFFFLSHSIHNFACHLI